MNTGAVPRTGNDRDVATRLWLAPLWGSSIKRSPIGSGGGAPDGGGGKPQTRHDEDHFKQQIQTAFYIAQGLAEFYRNVNSLTLDYTAMHSDHSRLTQVGSILWQLKTDYTGRINDSILDRLQKTHNRCLDCKRKLERAQAAVRNHLSDVPDHVYELTRALNALESMMNDYFM